MENKIPPKQALEELKFQVGNITYFTKDLQPTTRKVRDSGLFETIEQALTEYEKQTELLKVLKNKKVDIWIVDLSNNVKEYNNSAIYEKLTKIEFNLIKEWLK